MAAMSEKVRDAIIDQYQGVSLKYDVINTNMQGTVDLAFKDVSKGQAKRLLDLALEMGIIKKT